MAANSIKKFVKLLFKKTPELKNWPVNKDYLAKLRDYLRKPPLGISPIRDGWRFLLAIHCQANNSLTLALDCCFNKHTAFMHLMLMRKMPHHAV
jgi:hypothetical protein